MKILLTGTTGYIGQRLLLALLKSGHHVVCCVRDTQRFDVSKYGHSKIELVEVDFLKIIPYIKLQPSALTAYGEECTGTWLCLYMLLCS